MNLQRRIDLLVRLGDYMLSDAASWQEAKEKAGYENGWFIPEFIDHSARKIADRFLQRNILEKWTASYQLPSSNSNPKQVGIVMAGNIPLVGFHDFLCVFISGHRALIKPSSKDTTLIKHLVNTLSQLDPEVNEFVEFAEQLKNCDAYIATGSNNSAGYFEYYFKKYPHIIRRNRTSVAILTGNESKEELDKLADDVYMYFGLGCRNVTKIFVPEGYDFIPLLTAFKKYDYLADHHKYKNNYDYNLAIHLLNKKIYMSNKSLLLIEDPAAFSPISQLHYEFYHVPDLEAGNLAASSDIQCIVGTGFVAFGDSQSPSVSDYADRVDTLQFLVNLRK
jgi:hypothetical protein